MIPIVSSLISATEESCENFRAAISDVYSDGFTEDYSHEKIKFKINPREGIDPEVVGEYEGVLKGRNQNCWVGFGEDADKAIALRVLIDGHATKIS